MASTHHFLLIVSALLLGLVATGANARPGVHFHPCKTLFISYTITSLKSPNSLDALHNPNFAVSKPSGFFAVFSEIREFNPKPTFFPSSAEIFVDRSDLHHPIRFYGDDVVKPDISHPLPSGSLGVSSLRDRTKDILSVVVALLFGVGCGALTSATMYLAWSLITNRYELRDSERDDEDDYFGDDDVKKMGYVKIPVDPAASPIPAPAKESV